MDNANLKFINDFIKNLNDITPKGWLNTDSRITSKMVTQIKYYVKDLEGLIQNETPDEIIAIINSHKKEKEEEDKKRQQKMDYANDNPLMNAAFNVVTSPGYLLPSSTSSKNSTPTPTPESPPPPAEMVPIDETPGKEITIKFIQHAATNQCFIKEYNICDVLDVKESIGVDERELRSRLVLDMMNQPVIENIQSMNTIMIKNCTPTSSSSPGLTPLQNTGPISVTSISPAPAPALQAQSYTGPTSVTSISPEPEPALQAQSYTGPTSVTSPPPGKVFIKPRRLGGYNSTRSVTKSRKSMKPRKTSKYSPYNKFMRNTRRNRRRKPFL
jgi:hypothetical protein